MTLPSGIVTFMFTDIEGSSAKWDRAKDRMATAIERHDSLFEQAIGDHAGSLVKKMGDGLMAVFADPALAVEAALEAQREIASASWDEALQPLRVRIGLHTGPGDPVDGDYLGPSLNRAARLEAAGHGGQILTSAATRELVGDRAGGVQFRDLGEHHLRGLTRVERIFQVIAAGIDAEFPPLRTESTPTNLPARVGQFLGRNDELSDLSRTLDGARLITVTGAGGAGKTALAVEAARLRASKHPGGVWLLELAALSDGRRIVSEALGAMRRPAPADRDPEEVLLDALISQRALLVIDNCEHLISDVSDLVAKILRRAPEVTVLATSREPLGVDGEHVWSIPTMTLPVGPGVDDVATSDAGSLFLARATAADRTFLLEDATAPTVAAICSRLDGLPLAIELAAARVASMSLQEIDRHLDDRFKLLRGRTTSDIPHHATLRDTVAWSYDLLAPDDQRLYRRLSIFTGGFDATAAEALEGGNADVVDGLGHLVAQSLLEAQRGETTRFRMLETIRQFGDERLRDEGEYEDAAKAHLRWVFDLVREGARGLEGRDQVYWQGRFRQEIDNIRSALTWAHEHDPVTGARIAAALSRFFWMYATEGDSTLMSDSTSFLREGYDWATSMLETAGDELPETLRARLQLGIGGLLCVRLGLFEEALNRLAEAAEILQRQEDERNLGWARFYQGIAGYGLVEPTESEALFNEALRLHTGAEDRFGIAMSTLLLGLVHSVEDLGSGREYLERYAVMAAEIGVPFATAHAADSLAYANALLDSLEEETARQAADALAAFREINNYACLCHALGAAAAVLGRKGDTEGAARTLGIADATRKRLSMVIAPYEERTSSVKKIVGEAAQAESWARAHAEGQTFQPDEGIDWVIRRLGEDPEQLGSRS